ncbi:family 78 glycoside hydrolase catalytic domain [Flavicella sp.]|uniref:family 78 glycoside hydrolase catalytic domain n=1 Tax=Flavicella sp. TaxID=2957742 RepID=UPI00262AC1E9|nr:family 78 glycoside hydrolase catalytic domain [Flavicella sp.]MDG1806094.1 family 78 glycoside hydrolase catalytic domain [Flavicella sp.]
MKYHKNYLRKLITTLVVISFLSNLYSQENLLNNGVIGKWDPHNTTRWQQHLSLGQWIWLPKNSNSNLLFARKNFYLEKVLEKTHLAISASSKYELFINGKAICQGPARSAPHHQSYDLLDITSVLKTGANNISVKVHHQDKKKSYNHDGRPGLIAQIYSNETIIIHTDASWKVTIDPSWDQDSPSISRFQMIVNDNINFIHKIENWNQTDFDDSKWLAAHPLLRNSGWPSPKKDEVAYAITTPWTNLVQRDIPYLIEKDLKASELIEAITFENSSNSPLANNKLKLTNTVDRFFKKQLKPYNKKNQPIVIPARSSSESTVLLFDFGKIINGMPKLKIQGALGTEVQILSAPFIVDGTFSQKRVDSEYLDRLTLSGTKDTWQSMYFKPTRYLALTVKGNDKPVSIDFLGIHQIKYPFENKGNIEVDKEPWIQRFWKASVKTIDVTTTDALTDNYRERRQYAQTGYYAAMGNYWTFGDTALQRRYLIQVAQEQMANGIMPAYAPLAQEDYMVILDSNCLWIRSFYNYLLYSGDYVTVKELLPSAKKMMNLLHSFTDQRGLIYNPPYAYWLDHTLNDRTGANLCLNGHYLGALQDFTKALQFLEDEEQTKFQERSRKLKQSLATNFWNEENGLFVDAIANGVQSSKFSEHANAMALASGITTKQQAKRVATTLLTEDANNYIKRANGMTMVSPAMSYFLHIGLAENGYAKESLLLFNNRFSKMLHKDTNQTLWEEWWLDGSGRTGKLIGGRTRSDAQTESAFPPDLFVKYVLGIEVISPGMKQLKLSKPKAIFSDVKSSFPTPNGICHVEWKFKKNHSIHLNIPENTKIKLELSSLQSNAISLNGISYKGKENPTLKTGTHIIEY